MKILLTTFLLFCTSYLLAQQKNVSVGLIVGSIVDAQNTKAVAFATITASRMDDSTLKRQTIADKNGSFEIDKLPFAMYRLTITAIGYATMVIDSIHLRTERFDFNLGDVKLGKSDNALTDVIVYTEKPLIESKDGNITYNVGESALSSGSTTAEILKNMPLINSDPNGKILLKGKEPKILIDDKPTDLTAQQLADLLESMPGGSIEKIELMMNPPPQYASEAGGVINIVTKKGKIGWVGRVNLSAGTRGEGNLSTNVSYRNKKLSLSSTIGLGASQLQGNSYSRRENIYKDSTNRFNTDGNFSNKNLRPNLRMQMDYEFNKRNNLSTVYQGNLNFFDNLSETQYTNFNRFNQIYRLSTRENATDGTGYNHGLTVTYAHKGKNPAERLQIIGAANIGKNDNGRDFFQQFLNPDFNPTGIDSTQTQAINNTSNALTLRVNYDKPLKWKGASFTTGAVFSRNNYHNILDTRFLQSATDSLIYNDLLSTDFYFHQSIATVRAGINYTLPKQWRITASLQAEHTNFDFEFVKANAANTTNDYWNTLPTINIRKEFTRQFNTALVYRATIRRPGIGELNPAIDYNDPYNIRFGNPLLAPQLADNFDWNVSFSRGKYYINTSVGYNKVKNVFNTIRTLVEAGKTQVTWQNISDRQEYEASIFGGYTFSKKFRMNASAGYTFNQYGEAEKLLYKYRDGSSFYTSLNYNFTPNSLTTLEGNARYSSFADPQGRSRSNLTMNLGVQRKFFNKRLSVSFNMIDPFRVQQFTSFTYGSNFSLESFNSTRTRNFRIAIGYQLNKVVQPKKMTDKQKKELLNKLKKK